MTQKSWIPFLILLNDSRKGIWTLSQKTEPSPVTFLCFLSLLSLPSSSSLSFPRARMKTTLSLCSLTWKVVLFNKLMIDTVNSCSYLSTFTTGFLTLWSKCFDKLERLSRCSITYHCKYFPTQFPRNDIYAMTFLALFFFCKVTKILWFQRSSNEALYIHWHFQYSASLRYFPFVVQV